MAVNISARQFQHPDFVDTVRATLAASGFPPACLELELTESMLMEQVEQSIDTMCALRRWARACQLTTLAGLFFTGLPEALSHRQTENRPELCAWHWP